MGLDLGSVDFKNSTGLNLKKIYIYKVVYPPRDTMNPKSAFPFLYFIPKLSQSILIQDKTKQMQQQNRRTEKLKIIIIK